MTVIPAGSFWMGTTDQEYQWLVKAIGEEAVAWVKPEVIRRRITINRPFALAQTTVTRGQWARFVAETGYAPKSECRSFVDKNANNDKTRDWRSPGFPQSDDHPVVCVNYYDMMAYIRWLNLKVSGSPDKPFRLPSDSEWEYAARAGDHDEWRYWGNDETNSMACQYANVADRSFGGKDAFPCNDGYKYTAPVQDPKFIPNAFGLRHMLGNVMQIVGDCYYYDLNKAPTNGDMMAYDEMGGSMNGPRYCYRVFRGGGWDSTWEHVLAANRMRGSDRLGFNSVGFRLARTLD